MGLIRNVLSSGLSSLGSVVADQYKEYFYCDALPTSVLAVKGKKKNAKGNNKGDDNVISNGSVIAVADGQCMLITDNGKVAEVCAEPGEFTYDASTSAAISGTISKRSLPRSARDSHSAERSQRIREFIISIPRKLSETNTARLLRCLSV